MATQEIPTLVCDLCGTDTEDVRTYSVKLDRKAARFVEACEPCIDPLRLLVDAGRKEPTPPVLA